MDRNLSKFWDTVKDREDWHAAVSPWGRRVGHDLGTEQQQQANFDNFKTKKIPVGRVALGDWLGAIGWVFYLKCSEGAGQFSRSGRLVVMVAMGLHQFWR